MAEILEGIVIGDENVDRLEYLKMPNDITYTLGLSVSEVQEAFDEFYNQLTAVNDDLEDLKQEVLDDEFVITNSLNELKIATDNLEEGLNNVTKSIDENELVTAEALTYLNENVEKSGNNEKVVSESLNDLQRKYLDLLSRVEAIEKYV
jgi:phenylalanyl-tRNA synthetase alpha subunit